MKLEEQVCSLELAKELKEAGYEQEGLFYWGWDDDENSAIITCPHFIGILEDKNNIVAPTVAELGEILFDPEKRFINLYYPNAFRTKFKEKHKKWVIGNAYPLVNGDWTAHASTEANARAKCWLFLKKEGLL